MGAAIPEQHYHRYVNGAIIDARESPVGAALSAVGGSVFRHLALALMRLNRRMWTVAVLSFLSASLALTACKSTPSGAQHGALTGASKMSFCSGERTINAGLAQRAKATTDDMGLGVTLNMAKKDIATAARLGPSSARPRLDQLTEALHEAIDQVVTDGMGAALEPIVAKIHTDLNSFERLCRD
ncbi:MAG: hypothetical protein M3063_17330 [Actinomycetota bacterium]|nr:hypothetical protein [Actinomycetota bacterium]